MLNISKKLNFQPEFPHSNEKFSFRKMAGFSDYTTTKKIMDFMKHTTEKMYKIKQFFFS